MVFTLLVFALLVISDKVFNEFLLTSPSDTVSAGLLRNWEEKRGGVTLEKEKQSLNITFCVYL